MMRLAVLGLLAALSFPASHWLHDLTRPRPSSPAPTCVTFSGSYRGRVCEATP